MIMITIAIADIEIPIRTPIVVQMTDPPSQRETAISPPQ
jgi:hypothetical protein